MNENIRWLHPDEITTHDADGNIILCSCECGEIATRSLIGENYSKSWCTSCFQREKPSIADIPPLKVADFIYRPPEIISEDEYEIAERIDKRREYLKDSWVVKLDE